MICIKNGWVHDAVHEEPYIADILADKGKITAIGRNLIVPQDCEIVDATDKNVYPGFVEAHCHIGLDGSGIGFEGDDCNEMTDILTPQLRWPASQPSAPDRAARMCWAVRLRRSRQSASASIR